MSCIVGVKSGGHVVIGGDTQGTEAWTMAKANLWTDKVFKLGRVAIGFAGDYRFGQVLRYGFNLTQPPDSYDRESCMSYMVCTFIEEVRARLKAAGVAEIVNNVEQHKGTMLVGFNNRLYVVSSNHQVTESEDEYAAIGCGNGCALGVLATLSPYRKPEDLVTEAIRTTSRFFAGVNNKVTMVSTEVK